MRSSDEVMAELELEARSKRISRTQWLRFLASLSVATQEKMKIVADEILTDRS